MSPRIDGNPGTGGTLVDRAVPVPTKPISRPGSDIATRVEAARAKRATRAFRLLDPIEPDRMNNPAPVVAVTTIVAREPRPRVQLGHGTMAGYRQHYRHGTAPCDDCRAANAAVHRARRAKLRNGKPAMGRPPKFDVAAALERVAAGESIRAVARAFGVSNPALQHHVQKARKSQGQAS